MTKLLNRAEAAEVLGVSERTVRRLTTRGELASVKVGQQVRVHPDDLAAYIESLRPSAQEE